MTQPPPIHIRILTDGRPGHENQSMGLAEALGRRVPVAIETVGIRAGGRHFFGNLREAAKLDTGANVDLLLGAGHRVHLPLCFARARLGVPAVVLMKPSLPVSCFDLVVTPRHDATDPADTKKKVFTFGALNRLPEQLPEKTELGLFLIGGPSQHHAWDSAAMLQSIQRVLVANPTLTWKLADSRRTPPDFRAALEGAGLPLEYVKHEQTVPGWLPKELAAAKIAWVSEDSISMVYEAMTAQARVGILPVPQLKKESRVVRSVGDLVDQGMVALLGSDGSLSRAPLPKVAAFHEAGRCADILLERFFGGCREA